MRNCTRKTSFFISFFLVVMAGHAFASDEKTRQLEIHAQECLDYLKAFTGEEYNPQKALHTSFERGSLLLRYDENVIKQTDDLAGKWMQDCGDLFDSEKYGPKFFKDSPLIRVLENLIKDQEFAQKQSDQSVAEQTAAEKKSFKMRASFRNGVLEELELITPFYGNFQYRYNGESLIWDKLESDNPMSVFSSGKFSYKFVNSYDSLRYYSPFKHYWTEYNPNGGRSKEFSASKTWEKKKVAENAGDGKLTFDEGLFPAMSKGTNDKTWALKFGATVGLDVYFPTDNLLDDNGWVEDTSGIGVGFLVDATIGVVHCSPSSGKCFGFGAGYARNIFCGNKLEKKPNRRDSTEVFDTKHVNNLMVYGEYYIKGNTPSGIRQSIDIPLDADIKYITSKTGFFYDSWTRFEMGLKLSPIQYIPGVYAEIGFSFTTPSLW